MRSTKLIRTAKTGYIILSAALCALGLVLMLRPDISVRAIGIIVGCVLIAFGVVKLIGYFSKDLYRLAFQFDLAFGLLSAALGLVVLVKPHLAMGTLCVILGVEIIADGLFKVQTALDARRFGLGSWWLILALAALAGLVGVFMIVSPMEGAHTLTALLGASLLAQGALNLGVALCAVKILARSMDDAEPYFHL